MQGLYINPDWTFSQIFKNLKTLKSQYDKILASFSYFQMPELINFQKRTRDLFYSLEMEEWQKDKLWDYMNGYEFM